MTKLWILWMFIPVIWGNHSGTFSPGWIYSYAYDTKVECERQIIIAYPNTSRSEVLATDLMKCLREDQAPPGPVSEVLE